MRESIVKSGIFLAALAFAAPAAAQEGTGLEGDTPEIVESLFACREIADPTERLACFDREVDVVYNANEAKELVIADKEQVKEARRGLFGFTLPKIRLFSGGDDEEDEVKSISSTITRLRTIPGGKLEIVIEGGAKWVQTDSTPVLGSPGAGDSIEIRRAALGSYMAKIDGRRAIRVKRVD